MAFDITFLLFERYVQGAATPAEAAAVRAWLVLPAHQTQAQSWMQGHWDALAATPAPLAAAEPDYKALLAAVHTQLGFRREAPAMAPAQWQPVAAPQWRRWAAAATLALGLAGAGGWLLHSQRLAAPLALATDYGQTRRLRLPDGSEVTLNGHSQLRYPAHWATTGPREVWLDGEAYFSVQHQPNHQRFVVHTQAGFNVEVLGTKFTVYRRREQARVVLLTGKVRVDFDDQQRPDVILRPGELLETRDAAPLAVLHKTVHTAPYASWKDNNLVLDETSIGELATRLQDTYGIEVVVQSPALSQRRMSGTVPLRDLDVLLLALQEAFHLKATRAGNRIVLTE